MEIHWKRIQFQLTNMALKAAVHKNDGDEHIITWSRTSQMLSDTSDAIAKKHRIKPEVLTFKSIIITR